MERQWRILQINKNACNQQQQIMPLATKHKHAFVDQADVASKIIGLLDIFYGSIVVNIPVFQRIL